MLVTKVLCRNIPPCRTRHWCWEEFLKVNRRCRTSRAGVTATLLVRKRRKLLRVRPSLPEARDLQPCVRCPIDQTNWQPPARLHCCRAPNNRQTFQWSGRRMWPPRLRVLLRRLPEKMKPEYGEFFPPPNWGEENLPSNLRHWFPEVR